MNQQTKTFRLVSYAILGAMGTAFMFISFPIPFLPANFLSLDFSEIPVLLAAILFSPVAGIAVAGVKIALYTLFMGAGDPIGMVTNFMASLAFVLPIAYIYRRFRTTKSLVLGIGVGTVSLTVILSVLNYFIFLPAYVWLVGMDLSSGMMLTMVLGGILPFNLIKGIVVGAVFVPVFLKLYPLLKKQRVGATLKKPTVHEQ
ncbi:MULTISPECIES: ECF transporter S component [Geomicrobium]|uniref:Riboflavin transporter n=2 Tax=Geomicrobium TaxID=767528 RepID=A0ABS2PGK1_9BACL|nr:MULTISPECIES: ECF transporter S component [Geomicrobium]MBM7634567.1 riboflavin transporter FmnP [Geomicrobium sediminis]GAJ99738.1 substrate-specific component RibU of riboflavin ECF transporter [Geomicrobium sp. JCM 19055]